MLGCKDISAVGYERNSSCSGHAHLLEQTDLNHTQLHIRDEGAIQFCLLGARLKSVGDLQRKVYVGQREEGFGYDIGRNI